MGKAYRSEREAYRVRTEACRCAALVLASRPDANLTPMVWSLAVFFEKYIASGAKATQRDFGPKDPPKLRVVKPNC